MKQEGGLLYIGDSPQLVVNLKTQEHYIQVGKKRIPYRREISFSRDLLQGKRKQVLKTAVEYYYEQACDVARGMEIAEAFREKANTTQRERKQKGKDL